MVGYVIIGLLISTPLFLGVFLRVPTSHLFFSLMAGELLARYFHGEAEIIIGATLNPTAAQYTAMGILMAPLILTGLFLRNTLPKNKVILHIVPLIIMGIVLTAFVLPVLPIAAQNQISSLEIGRQMLELSDLVIGFVVLLQLVALWLLNGFKPRKHH